VTASEKRKKRREKTKNFRYVSQTIYNHPNRQRLAEILIAIAATRIRDYLTKKGCQGGVGA